MRLILIVLTVITFGGTDDITRCDVKNADYRTPITDFCPGDPNQYTDIHFKGSLFSEFPEIFKHFPNIYKIYISLTGIDRINAKVFTASSRKLMELVMFGNHLTRLENFTFAYLINLLVLDISKNLLVTIEPQAFSGLLNLKDLNLSYNRIQHIEGINFATIWQLESIRFTNNKIQSIKADTFEHNLNLRFADFSSNDIISIDQNSFLNAPFLSIDLSFNDLEKVNVSALTKLKKLRIADNKINLLIVSATVEEIHAENNMITAIESEKNSKLHRLYLASNKLSHFSSLTNFLELLSLDLSFNNFQKIDFVAIKDLTHLKELRLIGMKLSQIDPNDVIKMLPNLKTIALSTEQWPIEYVKKLEAALEKHLITLVEHSVGFTDDGITTDSILISPTVEATSETIMTKNPINETLEQLIKGIENRLLRIEKISDTTNDQFYLLTSELATTHTLVIVLFICYLGICVMYASYKYNSRCSRRMRYRRPVSDTLMMELKH